MKSPARRVGRQALAQSDLTLLTLLRQDRLRQGTGRCLSWETGEVIRVGRDQLRVIDVDDRRLVILRVDGDLEEVEQVARPRATPRAASAARSVVLRRAGHRGLREVATAD